MTDEERADLDLMLYGVSLTVDGKRVDPRFVKWDPDGRHFTLDLAELAAAERTAAHQAAPE